MSNGREDFATLHVHERELRLRECAEMSLERARLSPH
jgi:hypothetical protein